jgi:aminotransferase
VVRHDGEPETDITVTCGSTEAMVATLMAIVEPGDEVIVFDPFYENYGPDAILCGASLRHVPMPIGAPLDLDRLTAAFAEDARDHTQHPANPTGRCSRATNWPRSRPSASASTLGR